MNLRINKKIKNQFYFQTIYNLLYPAVLGTVFVSLLLSISNGDVLANGFFPLLATIILIWYFLLDYFMGLNSFKEEETSYTNSFMICDLVVVVCLFISFFGLWYSNNEFLVFASLSGLGLSFLYWSYLVEKNEFKIFDTYNFLLLLFSILSMIFVFLSLFYSDKQIYIIGKYGFIFLTTILLVLYTKYCLSEEP